MDASTPASSGHAPQHHEGVWTPRRGAALACAGALRGLPLLAAAIASLLAGQLLPRPDGLAMALWWAALALIAQLVLRLVEHAVRRLLPLSQLLGLSLVFPDRAPSRFAVALRLGNVERLHREVERSVAEGLPPDLDEACILALQLVRMVSDHDRGTRGHSDRVRAYTELLAEELGLSVDERHRLRWGALLHDVGKLAVPVEILNKAGRPSEEEWEVLKRHPLEGARIIAPLAAWLGDAAAPASQHHERWDGKGYPLGLAGEAIAKQARIVAVADALAVMTGARAYKKPQPMEVARREIAEGAGGQFDPEVSRALLSVSIGRLSRAAGPFTALLNVPLLGNVAAGASQLPATATAAVAAAGITAASVVAPQVALPERWTGGRSTEVSVLGTTVTNDAPPAAVTDSTVADGDAPATTDATPGTPGTPDDRTAASGAPTTERPGDAPLPTGSAGAALRVGSSTTGTSSRATTTAARSTSSTRDATTSTSRRDATTTRSATTVRGATTNDTLGGATSTPAAAGTAAPTTAKTGTDTTSAKVVAANAGATIGTTAGSTAGAVTSAATTAATGGATTAATSATSAATVPTTPTTPKATTGATTGATMGGAAGNGNGVAGGNANPGGMGNNTNGSGTNANSSGDNVNNGNGNGSGSKKKP